ncbi:high mobility group box domain-containing protein, partial [Mycena crocata]
HIPRPPNPFILFRSWFVKNQWVTSDVEKSHSNLSKIVGATWMGLPDAERQKWRDRAKKAEAEHRRDFPLYIFKP